MAGTDKAWKDDVAPEEGSPFRPLYGDSIKFSGQPIALVLAEEWEIARYAASLVRIEYEEQAFVTDLYQQRDQAFAVAKPDKPHGDAGRAFMAAAVRHEAEYFIPTEHHNPMELYASTAIWDGDGKLTVYDKTQGVQNVQRYLCSVFEKKPDEVRVMSPFVGGAFGLGLRPQYQVVLAMLGALALQRSVRLVLTRGQMYGLGHRPATIERLALGAKADGTLDSRSATRLSPSPRNSKSSPATTPVGQRCSTNPPTRNTYTGWRGSTFPPPATCARPALRQVCTPSRARWTNSP